jgi:phosphatidylinositol kinase/protein kinase (PI-3  family)
LRLTCVPALAQAAKDATAAGTPAPSPSKEVIALQGFISEYRPLINAQFIRSSGAELGKYQDIFLKLRKWQIALKRQLRRSAFPRQLEVLSRTLAESKGSQMEVPGQYLPVREPMPDQHIKVDRVLPDIDLAERCGAVHRRITIRGSDGKLYHFIVEATGSTIATGDERTIQLFQLLNR